MYIRSLLFSGLFSFDTSKSDRLLDLDFDCAFIVHEKVFKRKISPQLLKEQLSASASYRDRNNFTNTTLLSRGSNLKTSLSAHRSDIQNLH